MESWGICEQGWRKGPWTPKEDKLLLEYVNQYGDGRWSSVSKCTGLNRSGKSCRLRWVNYLRPGLKKGQLTPQEEGIIIELHALWGNKWSTIARYLPGRTDNEIKNYWRTHFKKRKPAASDDEMMIKQEKKRIMRQKVGENIATNKNVNFDQSPDQSMSVEDGSILDAGLFDYPSVEKDRFLPGFHDHQETNWCDDDFTPLDCYLWDGLWNLDSVQGGTKYYSCEGDGVAYGSLL